MNFQVLLSICVFVCMCVYTFPHSIAKSIFLNASQPEKIGIPKILPALCTLVEFSTWGLLHTTLDVCVCKCTYTYMCINVVVILDMHVHDIT